MIRMTYCPHLPEMPAAGVAGDGSEGKISAVLFAENVI